MNEYVTMLLFTIALSVEVILTNGQTQMELKQKFKSKVDHVEKL